MIEIRELSKFYGERRALGPVSASIEEGEVIGLLGLNGAGKTTTLRILACDLLPSSGTVKVGGIDVVDRPDQVRKSIGYLPDTPPLYDDMRVSEFLRFAYELRGRAPGGAKSRIGAVGEELGLTRVLHDPLSSLSHGYRQRVGIAQAIVHEPKLVILDEPISGLDPVQIVEMRRLVRQLKENHTVIVSSHILSEISETCDRLLVLREGEIVASGTEAELSRKLLEGVRVELSVRGDGNKVEPVRKVLQTVEGVSAVKVLPALEAGENVLSFGVQAERDVRELLARALHEAQLPLLFLAKSESELEDVFLRLADGTPGNGAAEKGTA